MYPQLKLILNTEFDVGFVGRIRLDSQIAFVARVDFVRFVFRISRIINSNSRLINGINRLIHGIRRRSFGITHARLPLRECSESYGLCPQSPALDLSRLSSIGNRYCCFGARSSL